jgi:xanthine dehydrogenase accessory factor
MSVRIDDLVLVRGGGDLATGVVARLHRSGFRVVVTELERPLTVRRTVSLSSAVATGIAVVEDLIGVRASADRAMAMAAEGVVPVAVSEALPPLHADVVVDARLAKRVLDTTIGDAPLVVALGPPFVAGRDCHVVIETNRGPNLGRAIWSGAAEPDTGTPGSVGGHGAERVLRAPAAGAAAWTAAIGDVVEEGAFLGSVGNAEVRAPFRGVVRGLIAEGTVVPRGLKVGDVDPRVDTDCSRISDKALAVGSGVLQAVLTWDRRAA